MITDTDPLHLSARQKALLDLVRTHGYVATEQMVRQFDVTPQTIRRDINVLSDLKLIERFHGGAGRVGTAHNQPYTDRLGVNIEAKRRIASAVADAIPDAASLFLNIGTTTETVAEALTRHKDLRVVTNNINIANILRQSPTCDVMIAGGVVRASDGGIVGEATTDFLNQFRLDIGIIGISGIAPDGTLLDFDYQEIRSARAIIRNSEKVFLVADRSKFGRSAMVRLGDYSDIHLLFTDAPPPPDFVAAIEAADLDLHIAD